MPTIKSRTRSIHLAVHAINNLAARQAQSRTPMLGDNNGLGRPQTFSGDEAQFQRWSQEAESFYSGVFPDRARLLALAAERTDEISSNKINYEFRRWRSSRDLSSCILPALKWNSLSKEISQRKTNTTEFSFGVSCCL